MLKAWDVNVSVEQARILSGFHLEVEPGEVVSIIGPNGSGKSTALKALSRLLPVTEGHVWLDGKELRTIGSRGVSKLLSVLFQANEAPADLTVEALVQYGRTPHKKWYERMNAEDFAIVEWAIEKTGLTELRKRQVISLSGGEAQRAWIAMSLAQRPKVLLLDEPTTYLDIAHQLQLLELIHDVNRELGMTIVMVLHDLNQASIYSDKICVLSRGKVVRYGKPDEVITREMVRMVYGVDCEIQSHFHHGKPLVNLFGIFK